MSDGGDGGGIVMLLVQLVIVVVTVASMWKIFTKAGQPGWAALVPIYNIVVLLQIVGKPIWWIVLMLIPLVNIVVAVILSVAVAKSFGKGAGFGIGLMLLSFIFYPILAFGDAQYVGPEGA